MKNLIQRLYKDSPILFSGLILILLLRTSLPYLTFSGTDLEGLSLKYLYLHNSIDIYDLKKYLTSLPYFPYSLNIYLIAGRVADEININYVFVLKYLALIFELLVAGLIIAFYQKRNFDLKSQIIILSVFLINPLMTYITSFFGFFETLWIFFLLLSVYLFEFEDKKKKNIYIPFFLALSACIKPISIFFVFYFFYKNSSKLLFLFMFFSTFFLLNLFFIVGNFETPNQIIDLLKVIFFKFVQGAQVGDFGLSEIEKLYVMNFNFYSFEIFKSTKIIEIILILYIYFISLNSQRIKSYEFIYLIFFIVYLFNDNIHINYLYWIFPFAILINVKKTLISGILLIIACLSAERFYNANYLMLNFLNIFDFIQSEQIIDDSLSKSSKILFIDIIIYYIGIIVLFNKEVFKKIKLTNFNFQANFKKIFFESFKFKKILINDFSILLKKNNYNICFYLMIILSIFQFSELKEVISSDKKIFGQLSYPQSINLFKTHGHNIEFKTNFNLEEKRDLDLNLTTGYFSKIYINNKKIFSSRNILNYIWDAQPHYEITEEKIYPFRKINITNKLKQGNNEIKIVANIPHSLKEKFGLIFLLLYQNKIFKNTNDFVWNVSVNKNPVSYNFDQNIKDNYHYKNHKKLMDNFLHVTPDISDIKVLNYQFLESKKGITPIKLIFLIFLIISLINLIYLKTIKRISF